MLIVPRGESTSWVVTRGLRLLMGALGVAALCGAACSDDEEPPPPAICTDPVLSGITEGARSTHCLAEDGSAIVQTIGECSASGEGEEHEHEEGEEHDEADAGEEHEEGDAGAEHEHEDEEYRAPNFGNSADDDDCKYSVSFTNTCIAVGQPVTFSLSLTRKFDNRPGSGTNPAFPEVFLESDGHLSPSNDIEATEGPDGTYRIGPVVFDTPGRWVIRFHYFENCSDVAEDSPHGHAAFYIDVP
jgi:hypothetical protein